MKILISTNEYQMIKTVIKNSEVTRLRDYHNMLASNKSHDELPYLRKGKESDYIISLPQWAVKPWLEATAEHIGDISESIGMLIESRLPDLKAISRIARSFEGILAHVEGSTIEYPPGVEELLQNYKTAFSEGKELPKPEPVVDDPVCATTPLPTMKEIEDELRSNREE